MTARALIKSPTAQRSSPSSTSPGGSTPQLPNQSVQADGMRDRLPSGSTTNNNGTPCRVSPLITARRHPSKGCRLRVMTTEVGKSWEWVVCGVFVANRHCRRSVVEQRDRDPPRSWRAGARWGTVVADPDTPETVTGVPALNAPDPTDMIGALFGLSATGIAQSVAAAGVLAALTGSTLASAFGSAWTRGRCPFHSSTTVDLHPGAVWRVLDICLSHYVAAPLMKAVL